MVDTIGNVYVTGRENRDDLGEVTNIWLGKYDTNGNLLWTETYNSPANNQDTGKGIAVDSESNVYVIGYEDRISPSEIGNIWLRKYNADGNTLWTRTCDNGEGKDIFVDAMDNVYVTGYVSRSDLPIFNEMWLRKYDNNGNTLWTERYIPEGTSEGYGVAVNTTGDVFVTGFEHLFDTQQAEHWLKKYDANGSVLWTEIYDTQETGFGVTVNTAGNIYVTGCSGGDIWLRKYNPSNGDTVWTDTYDSSAHGYDYGCRVAVDTAGNAYVTGCSDGDIWLRKYDTDGGVLWTQTYSSGIGYAVDVDTAGNVYIAGFSDNDIILLNYAQVPEPGTIALISAGLLGFAGVLRRKLR